MDGGLMDGWRGNDGWMDGSMGGGSIKWFCFVGKLIIE